MNFASEASKLVTNKYFLYFVAFLAASNVLGYIVTNKINAVIFFALVAFLMSNFSKNMTVVLLVSIVATNLLMANKSMREGLENATISSSLTEEQKASAKDSAKAKSETIDTDIDTDKLSSVDHKLGAGLSALKKSGNSEEAKAKLDSKKASLTEDTEEAFEDMEYKPVVDQNNRDLNKRKTETETFKANSSSKKNRSVLIPLQFALVQSVVTFPGIRFPLSDHRIGNTQRTKKRLIFQAVVGFPSLLLVLPKFEPHQPT